MASEWRETTWGEEVSLEYGKAIRGYQKAKGNFRVFGSNGPVGWTDEALADGPGVILGRKGAYRGVQFSRKPFWVIDTAYFVVPKTELDMLWLYYAIKHYKLGEIDDGSPIPSTTRAAVYVQELTVPSLEEQRAIAEILGALDDRIDNLRQTNATLEAIAAALFKSWFVDFDGVAQEDMQESELGLIPKGWEFRPVGDFAELKGGKQLAKEEIAETGSIPVFGGAGVMGYTTSHNAEGFVITVGRVGAYCGQFFAHRGKAYVNNNASLIRQLNEAQGEWLFLSLRNADIETIKKGAAQPFVSNGDIANMKIVWPGIAGVNEFSQIVGPLMRRAEQASDESRTLAQLRDTLLPRLISGQLRIGEAARLADEIA